MDLAIFLFLITTSAFFSAAETSFFSLRESQVRLMEKSKEWNARLIARLKSDPQSLLVTLLIGNNLSNVAIASFATVVAIDYFDSFGAGIATGISAIVIILVCELFPKSFAISHRKVVAQWLAYPLFICYMICLPASMLFRYVERLVSRHFKTQTANIVSEEEIRIMAELGLEHGEIDRAEQKMIENIFRFDDIPVSEIMTPKKKIDALNGEVSVDHIAYYVSQSGFSRFPVYEGNPNSYIGYVHTNDVMRVLNSDDRDKPLSHFVSPLHIVEETRSTSDVFGMMTKEDTHIFLVHKKGKPDKIVGLVTLENLLEEIVGEIYDESDRRARIAAKLAPSGNPS